MYVAATGTAVAAASSRRPAPGPGVETSTPRRQLVDLVVTDDDDVASAGAKGVTVCTVYALDRSASAGLGVVGGVVGIVGAGGTGGGDGGGGGSGCGSGSTIGGGVQGVVAGICGPANASLSATDYVTAACYPPGPQLTLTASHPQPHVVDPAMTPTSAPVPTPTSASGPNNPVAMSQLGTVYATKRRRRNGKRLVTLSVLLLPNKWAGFERVLHGRTPVTRMFAS